MDIVDETVLELCRKNGIPILESKVPLKRGYEYVVLTEPYGLGSFETCDHEPIRVSVVPEVVTRGTHKCPFRWGGLIKDPDGPITLCPKCGGYQDAAGQWHGFLYTPRFIRRVIGLRSLATYAPNSVSGSCAVTGNTSIRVM